MLLWLCSSPLCRCRKQMCGPAACCSTSCCWTDTPSGKPLLPRLQVHHHCWACPAHRQGRGAQPVKRPLAQQAAQSGLAKAVAACQAGTACRVVSAREHAGRAPGCRRPGDDLYGPTQKPNVMLQRILVADYVFPESKVLRCGAAMPRCCRPVAW